MYKFETIKIEEINGTIEFHKLSVNGRFLFDEFYDEIKSDKIMLHEFNKIHNNMQQVSDGLNIGSKCKQLTGRVKNDSYPDYEFKSKHLRVYFFIDSENKRVIVIGGKKKNQSKDIKKMRNLKMTYFKLKTE